jgi:uncharacterized protein (DUF433 family)
VDTREESTMTKANPPLQDRIIQDPAIMVGKPVVRGTRIPVERVLAHLAENPDLDDLFAAFPHLTLDDVKACLAYAQARVARVRKATRQRAPVGASSAHA